MQTTAVYACVRILSETLASLPLHTYRHTERGKEKAIDHNLYYLLHDEPNPEMTLDCTGFAGHVEKTYNEVKGRVRNYEREQISQKV